MAPHDGEIANLAHAYRVLDVPWDASPRAIKASYRKLVAWRNEYIPHDPQQDAAEFYRVVERARAAGGCDDAARPFDWLGFIVRFVLGALFGALVSFRVMISLSLAHPNLIPIGIAVRILFCALASAFGGDAFWRTIRPWGIWWWRRWD